ncbi:hypothetical protein [Enterobacter intestinihominis]|uniref:hypothetical protein n=1 Tax=Enterobacter intestinihominis TaxID=3133180 RepID=UPI003B279BBB
MSKPKTDTYDVIYSRIRRITKLRTAEGDIRFTATMKLIYAYIWTFQENKNRGNDDPIHTNTNVIAWEVGVSEKAAIDALKALDAAKVVIKRTVKVRGNVNSSNYTAIPPASVAVLGITPPHPDESKSKPKKKKVAVGPTGDALHHGSATGTDEPTNEEKKGDDESDQGNAGKRDGVSDVYSDQHDDISANDDPSLSDLPEANPFTGVDAVNGAESERWETPQRADIFDLKIWREEGPSGFGFMEYGKEHGETDVDRVVALIDQHYFEALKQITIFDEDGVVTEEFINALSGDADPNRNADGSLQSIKYVYWVARHSQDERDGIPVRTCEEYMAEARPEHIPAHLLPKEHRAEPKPEPVDDLSNETIPF